VERQNVAIDLHLNRSVVVRENETGEKVGVTRIDKDPLALARPWEFRWRGQTVVAACRRRGRDALRSAASRMRRHPWSPAMSSQPSTISS
jgi:hypothetical protein